jgi:hypothetical protein
MPSPWFEASFAVTSSNVSIVDYSPGGGDVAATFTAFGSNTCVGTASNVGYWFTNTAGAVNVPVQANGATAPSNSIYYSGDIAIGLTSSTSNCGLAFDMVDGNNYWYVTLAPETNTLYVIQTVAGTATVITFATVTALTVATYEILLWIIGGSSPTVSVAWGPAGSPVAVSGLQAVACPGLVVSGRYVGMFSFNGNSHETFTNLQSVAAPTEITLSGANTGTVGVASGTITATLDQPAGPLGVVVSLTVATITGTFTTTPFTIASGQTVGTFTFNASEAGTGLISATSPGLTTGTRSFTASPAEATTLTLSTSPTTAMAVNTALTVEATPNGPATGTATFTPTGSAAGGLSPQVVTFSGGSTPLTANFTPTVLGTLTVTLTTTTGLTVEDSPVTLMVSNLVTCLTSVLGTFATGLTGTAGYRTSTTGSYSGSYTTSGVVESIPGNYQARFNGVPGTIYTAEWYDGTSLTAEDTTVVQGQSLASTSDVAFDSGTVLASPAPTATTFSSNSTTLTATVSGAYEGQSILFQNTLNLGRVNRIVVEHTVTAGSPLTQNFTLTTRPGVTPVVGPSPGDTFVFG